MGAFTSPIIMALVEVVTGGSASSQREPIGIYRSGPVLEQFFGAAGINLHVGSQSRVPAVLEVLREANQREAPEGFNLIKRVIEQVADSREYIDAPDRVAAVVRYLNERLQPDEYELRLVDSRYRLLPVGTHAPVASALSEAARVLNLDSVAQDFERALQQSHTDPEDAITAACSTVESVCKCILDELGEPYPREQTISRLVKEVMRHLDLSPEREDIDTDLRQIVGGLSSVAGGIGALRTHSGDAHGRGVGIARAASRTARLAIHAASTISLFLIETWQTRRHS